MLLEPLVHEERGQPKRSRRLVQHYCQKDDHYEGGYDTMDWRTKILRQIDIQIKEKCQKQRLHFSTWA